MIKWTKCKDEYPIDGEIVFVKFMDGKIAVGLHDGREFYPTRTDIDCGSGLIIFYYKIVAWAMIPKEMTEVLND